MGKKGARLTSGAESAAAAFVARVGKMPYFSIPDDVLGDDAAVVEWARLAAQVARDAKKR